MEVTEHVIACTLTVLYLPGGPSSDKLPRRRWQKIDRAIRRWAADLDNVQSVLEKEGFWLESAVIGRPGLLSLAEKYVLDRRVLVACQDRYPSRWLSTLGESAPPVLWLRGEMPSGPFFGLAGSRRVEPSTLSFASRCGEEAVSRGYCLLSGGASGCDRAAAQGALGASIAAAGEPRLCEILPYGLNDAHPVSWCRLSLAPPAEGFSTAYAMERNALIYAAGPRSLVAHSRFKVGGAWHGAVDCLRRRLSRLFVREDHSEAARALSSLGAVPVGDAAEPFEIEVSEQQHALTWN